MLGTTQFIIFEIGDRCNLGREHQECPNRIREATGPQELTDEVIENCMQEAYHKLNFTGLVGWHYYNEPMLQHQRLFSLMERNPYARYVLWTNGTIQPDDERIKLFEQVHCTDYSGSANADYYRESKYVSVFKFKRFDGRLADSSNFRANNRRCLRHYVEFILDAWGTAHLCCQDWRGEIAIGSIWQDSYATLAQRRREIMESMKRGQYPERCRRCRGKSGLPRFDKDIHQRTRRELDGV